MRKNYHSFCPFSSTIVNLINTLNKSHLPWNQELALGTLYDFNTNSNHLDIGSWQTGLKDSLQESYRSKASGKIIEEIPSYYHQSHNQLINMGRWNHRSQVQTRNSVLDTTQPLDSQKPVWTQQPPLLSLIRLSIAHRTESRKQHTRGNLSHQK